MATISKLEDLDVWKTSRTLYQKISKLAIKLKLNHDYRFAEQIKSSAGSIMDNIAEGFERNSRLEFVNSLSYAKGETGELKSQLYRCLDDNYLTIEEFNELYADTDTVSRKIFNFIKYLNTSKLKGLKFKDRVK